MKKLFGTDGIRGVANQYPITAELALSLGRALVHVFRNGHIPRILIGKDTRLSGYMLETALASGVCSMGGRVLLVGPMPTPGIAFLTSSMRADAGVVISASHNPFEDNGIKLFDGSGYKLPDETENEIEDLVLGEKLAQERPTNENVGKAFRIEDAIGRYIQYAKSCFPQELTLDGLKVVLDCAHGAAYNVAPSVFSELGAEVVVIGAQPDGKNINRDCGALHPQNMAKKVLETGAHLGIALDGDGDRVVFVDHEGQVVDGDAILVTLAKNMSGKGKLKKNTLVTTVMSNLAVERVLAKAGCHVVRCQVGDRYVVQMMRENGFNFGGENSGHMIHLDHGSTGDGIVSALQVLACMKESGRSLAEMTADYRPFPQSLRGVRVGEKKDFEKIPEVKNVLLSLEKELGQNGRILVRYSGTEPLLRIMVEAGEEKEVDRVMKELTDCFSRYLGVV